MPPRTPPAQPGRRGFPPRLQQQSADPDQSPEAERLALLSAVVPLKGHRPSDPTSGPQASRRRRGAGPASASAEAASWYHRLAVQRAHPGDDATFYRIATDTV